MSAVVKNGLVLPCLMGVKHLPPAVSDVVMVSVHLAAHSCAVGVSGASRPLDEHKWSAEDAKGEVEVTKVECEDVCE